MTQRKPYPADIMGNEEWNFVALSLCMLSGNAGQKQMVRGRREILSSDLRYAQRRFDVALANITPVALETKKSPGQRRRGL